MQCIFYRYLYLKYHPGQFTLLVLPCSFIHCLQAGTLVPLLGEIDAGTLLCNELPHWANQFDTALFLSIIFIQNPIYRAISKLK